MKNSAVSRFPPESSGNGAVINEGLFGIPLLQAQTIPYSISHFTRQSPAFKYDSGHILVFSIQTLINSQEVFTWSTPSKSAFSASKPSPFVGSENREPKNLKRLKT
jgi:hypothetical protein